MRELNPIEFYKARVRLLTPEEGGRQTPVHHTFGNYRIEFTLGREPYHGVVFMEAPSVIELGVENDVELAFWCCNHIHPFKVGDRFFLHEGPKRVGTGEILEKGIKQYVRPD